MSKVTLKEHFDALREADRRCLDARFLELEASIDRRFAGQYTVGNKVLMIVSGVASFVLAVAAIAKWHL